MDHPENNIKTIAINFLQLTATGNVNEAFYLYVGADFRHHNIHFKGDADSLKAAMTESAAYLPAKQIEIRFAIAEGNMVAVYSKVTISPGEPGIALAHFFRFEQDKIIELWDMVQTLPEDALNEHGLF